MFESAFGDSVALRDVADDEARDEARRQRLIPTGGVLLQSLLLTTVAEPPKAITILRDAFPDGTTTVIAGERPGFRVRLRFLTLIGRVVPSVLGSNVHVRAAFSFPTALALCAGVALAASLAWRDDPELAVVIAVALTIFVLGLHLFVDRLADRLLAALPDWRPH